MPLPEKPKTLQIVKSPKPPILDGNADEESWKTAATIDEFLLLGDNKNKPKAKTIGKLSYDDNFFYVAAICEETGRNDPFITGGPVYGDDCIEIWIDANGDKQTFHQLIVNAKGKSQGFGPAGMIEMPAKCTAQAEPGKQWSLEVAIPYSSLGIAAPKVGQKWKFNLARNRPKGEKFARELITWNPLQSRFKELDLFGTIIFGATTTAAKIINSKCPLTGKPVNPAHTFAHKGMTVGFCCPDCLTKFKKEPDKYFAKVKP
jgi:YHS domain-containing protein